MEATVPKFVLFDDLDDGSGEILQIAGLSDWVEDLAESGYTDNMWGVYFEVDDQEEEALKEAGVTVQTMQEILNLEPDALFGYSWGNPTCFDTMLAYDYINEMGLSQEDYGVSLEIEDEYDDYEDVFHFCIFLPT